MTASREDRINEAYRRGREAGLSDAAAWQAWDASGRVGKFTPTKPPYDAAWLYMPWLDGFVGATREAVEALVLREAA